MVKALTAKDQKLKKHVVIEEKKVHDHNHPDGHTCHCEIKIAKEKVRRKVTRMIFSSMFKENDGHLKQPNVLLVPKDQAGQDFTDYLEQPRFILVPTKEEMKDMIHLAASVRKSKNFMSKKNQDKFNKIVMSKKMASITKLTKMTKMMGVGGGLLAPKDIGGKTKWSKKGKMKK